MLKMVSKKSLLLLGAVLALCAFALPSVASAASWAPVGTTDGRIDSGNLGFSSAALGSGAACSSTTFSVSVHNAAVATITGASFRGNCHGNAGSNVGCTLTLIPTGFPWTLTAIDTTKIQIHADVIDVHFHNTPGTLGECANNGLTFQITGTITVSYTPVPKVIDINGAPGWVIHIPGIGSIPAAAQGTGTATGLLNVLMAEVYVSRCVRS